MKGIRQRKSGNFEVRVHRNKVPYRLGTYQTYDEALKVYEEFINKNPKISRKTHGMRHSTIYRVWQNMLDRCYNKNNPEFHRYGGRGIFVCSDWINSFECFYEEMNNGYKTNLQIDRVNNEDGYYKENCRWTTRSINCANKSDVKGVRKLPSGRFFASIKIEKTRYTIGTFDTEEQAIAEFRAVHKEWYGF